MTEVPELNQDTIETLDDIIARPATTTPTEIIVSGPYPSWGYDGHIKLRYSLTAPGSNTILLRTLSYYLQASYQPASSQFKIIVPGVSDLIVNPSAINQWMSWDSSAQSTSRTYTFYFVYQYLPSGFSVTIRRDLTIPLK